MNQYMPSIIIGSVVAIVGATFAFFLNSIARRLSAIDKRIETIHKDFIDMQIASAKDFAQCVTQDQMTGHMVSEDSKHEKIWIDMKKIDLRVNTCETILSQKKGGDNR